MVSASDLTLVLIQAHASLRSCQHSSARSLGGEGQEGRTHGTDSSRILLQGEVCGTLSCQGTAAVQKLKRGSSSAVKWL